MGDIPTNVYTQQSKKNFIFTMLFETVIMMVMFGYFLCVTAAYSTDMHGPEEDAAAVPPVDETAKSEKPKSEKPKSEKPKSEEEKGDDAAPVEDPPAE